MVVVFSKLKVLAMAGIAGFCSLCYQTVGSEEPSDSPDRMSDQRGGELGLNLFGLSLHTNPNAGYNALNPGLGLRYEFWHPTPRWTVFGDIGIYYDSDRHWAKYVALGASYRIAGPWSAGLGVTYGQSQSYNHGKPFFAVVPGIGFEHRRVVYSAVLLPSETSTSKVAGVAFFVTLPLEKLDRGGS